MDEVLLRSWDKRGIKISHLGTKSNKLTKEEEPNSHIEKNEYSRQFISSI